MPLGTPCKGSPQASCTYGMQVTEIVGAIGAHRARIGVKRVEEVEPVYRYDENMLLQQV